MTYKFPRAMRLKPQLKQNNKEKNHKNSLSSRRQCIIQEYVHILFRGTTQL